MGNTFSYVEFSMEGYYNVLKLGANQDKKL